MNELVSACIQSYYQAVKEDDKVTISRILEALEEVRLNEAEWQVVRAFYEKHSLWGRLEVVTRRLIRSQHRVSIKPYVTLVELLVRSKRLEEGRATIANYRSTFGDVPAHEWEIANTLFMVEEFNECLQFVRRVLLEKPDLFIFRAMECRVLWRLGQHKDARTRLIEMRHLLGGKVDNWIWYGSIASGFNETDIAKEVAQGLVDLLENTGIQISRGAAFYLINAGFGQQCKRLIEAADPGKAKDLSELEYLFERAWEFGSYKAVRKLGEAILAAYPNSIVKDRLSNLSLLQRLEGRSDG